MIQTNSQYTSKDVLETILTSSWNRRNDIKYTRSEKTAYFQNLLAQKVYADSGSTYSIGSGWACKFGWSQYILTTYSGDYTEWKAAYYLEHPVDGKDYYAMALEGAMDPKDDEPWPFVNHSSNLNYYSTANGNGQSNLLKSYAPVSKPSSYTWTFSIGGSLAESGYGGDIGASWPITYNDLTFTDSSSPSQQKMNIYFQYSEGTTYSRNTSWQDASFIYQAPAGSTYCILDNGRVAKFVCLGAGGLSADYYSATKGYATYVYK